MGRGGAGAVVSVEEDGHGGAQEGEVAVSREPGLLGVVLAAATVRQSTVEGLKIDVQLVVMARNVG